MPWLRIDDKFATHPKIAALSDREFRVHMRALCYCAEYRTEGVLPAASLREVRGLTPRVAERLIAIGLWEREDDGGLSAHDFAIYNGATIGARVTAYLERNPNASSNDVHKALGGKRDVVLAEVARYQNGSRAGS